MAFSTIDDEPWEAGAEAGALLDRIRELASLGIGLTICTEMLDCGAEASDVLSEGVPLDEARLRFPTVFRGEPCGSGLNGRPRHTVIRNIAEATLSVSGQDA